MRCDDVRHQRGSEGGDDGVRDEVATDGWMGRRDLGHHHECMISGGDHSSGCACTYLRTGCAALAVLSSPCALALALEAEPPRQ